MPAEDGVLGRLEEPSEAELEDSFLKYAGSVSASRKSATAYHIDGRPEPDDFVNLTTMMLSVPQVKAKAKEYSVSVTELMAAAMMKAIAALQDEDVPRRRQRPVKVLVPVNLRNLFPSKTLRNFSLFVTPEMDGRLGDYSLEELCDLVHHRLGLEVTPKQMSAKIATNVNSERSAAIKLMPLFIKNAAMKAAFNTVGERKACICMSNLGAVKLPQVMRQYVKRMDFIIGVQARAPYNCGVISYGDTMYINIIRNTVEPTLEASFFSVLRDIGLHVKVESNQRS